MEDTVGHVTVNDQDSNSTQISDLLEMNQFIKVNEEIEKSFSEVKVKVDQCELCSRQLLDATTDEDLAREECKMNILITSIDKNCFENRLKLMALSARNVELSKVAPRGSGDLRMRRLKTAALAQKFAEIISNFQNIQRASRMENNQLIERQYKISKCDSYNSSPSLFQDHQM